MITSIRTTPSLLLALCLVLCGTGEAWAVTLNPGDILVADTRFPFDAGRIIRVDPTTGAQTVIASGGTLANPYRLAVAANGDILVVDRDAFGGGGGVIRVDPVTGTQTTVSSNGFFVEPSGIAIAANGDILVTDAHAVDGGGAVIRIDPATGAQTIVSSGGNFVDPDGIAIAANGDIFVVDVNSFGGPGGVIRVDPATGAQTVISSGGFFLSPHGIAIAANGDLLVAEGDFPGGSGGSGPGGVIRIDPVTGNQTPVSLGGTFVEPVDIAVAPNGDILIGDNTARAVIRVNPVTGAQTIVSSGGSFSTPDGIAIVPGPLSVSIDIKPGSFPNSINPRNRGTIPVAILSTISFDAATVNATSVRFGPSGTEAAPVRFALEDVNGDGHADMVLHFNTQDTGIVCGAASASLTGETFGGQAIEGSDSVKTVGCK